MTGARANAATARGIAHGATMGMLVFIALAFGTLTYAFVTSDFSIADVANNSHTLKPLIYKISGVWGNHEGSMLLWVLVLSLYAGLVSALGRGGPQLTSAALGVQGLLASAFLLFILFTSNPFLRLDPAPFEGAGLNPLLQDPGLAIHPPMLYAGYVGLSASFSYAAAALIVGEEGWARAARPFMLIAWIALTCGIALGSWWAYYELGWGGFWFWDPVENASLMPWLVATALLHSALATERSGAFRTWTLLLAIAGFSMSLIGTFLVRSGVLSSVHAFASDPTRGFFIMVLIFCAIGGALGLFAWRAPTLRGGAAFDTVSRETALAAQQCLSGRGLRRRFCRHALSAGAGCDERRKNFRRAALLCRHLRADLLRPAAAGAVRSEARLAARRSEGGGEGAGAGAGHGGCGGTGGAGDCQSALSYRRLCLRGGGLADRRQHSRVSSSARARAPAPLPPPWPMPDWALP